MSTEVEFTVPTVVLVAVLCAVVLVAWHFLFTVPVYRWMKGLIDTKLDDWAEKEKAKINAKYEQDGGSGRE